MRRTRSGVARPAPDHPSETAGPHEPEKPMQRQGVQLGGRLCPFYSVFRAGPFLPSIPPRLFKFQMQFESGRLHQAQAAPRAVFRHVFLTASGQNAILHFMPQPNAAARRVYLDYNATTPVDREVLAAMLPFFCDAAGNASSIHSAGRQARSAVENARAAVAQLMGAKPAEIVFTSGGTEADNLAIFGSIGASNRERKHIICSSIEHHAVLEACEAAEKRGVEITLLPVASNGIVDPEDVRRAIRPETILVTVMHANNELGTIQPVEEIGRIAREAKVRFHTDAVQSVGKIPVDVKAIGADLLSLSAHKICGPKGVGVLYVREGTPLEPMLRGGSNQRDRRPGTENVPG